MKGFSSTFLSVFLPLAVLLVGGAGVYGTQAIEQELMAIRNQEAANVRLGGAALGSKVESLTRDLLFLSRHSAQRDAVNQPTPRHLEHLAEDFVNFMAAKGIYDQVRWLDETGMERVRVNLVQGKPEVVPADRLQNKADRDYFRNASKLDPGEVFISPLDLNIEHGRVEVPNKPMIRIATPIADQGGRKRGIVILNYYGEELLRAAAMASAEIAGRYMVLNSQGYWLRSANPADEWGFMFKRPELTLAVRSPVAWDLVSSLNRGQEMLDDGLWTWGTVYPLLDSHRGGAGNGSGPGENRFRQYFWKSVSHYPANRLNAIRHGIWLKVGGTTLALLGLAGLASWRRARDWTALAEAEVRYKTVANFTNDWETWVDPNGHFKYCSPSCARVTGRSADEFMANPRLLNEIVHPDDQARLDMHRRQDANSERTCEFDFRIVRTDGEVRWLAHVCQPVFGEAGEFLGRRASNRDITERKEMERKLVSTEALEHIREITRQVPGIIFQFRLRPDGSSSLPFISEGVREIYRLGPEAIGNDASGLLDLVHPEDREGHLATIQASARDLTPWQHEFRLKFADGSERTLLGNAVPQREVDGSTLWNGFTTDITEWRQAEEMVREGEKRFRITFENAAIGIAHVAPDGRFLRINQRFCDIVGYTREEMLARTFQDITYPDDLEADLHQVVMMLEGAIQTYSMEKRYIRKDSTLVWVNLTVALLRKDRGEPEYFIAAVEDITERKRVEEELRRNEDLTRSIMDSLASSIAVLDQAGNIIQVNRHWRDFAAANGGQGGTLDGVGMNYLDVCRRAGNSGEKLAESALSGMQAVLAGEAPFFQMEYPCHSPVKQRWFMLQASPLIGPANGLVIIHSDISQRRLAEDKMQLDGEHQATLRQILEATLMAGSTEETMGHCLARLLELSWLKDLPMAAVFLSDRDGQRLRLAISHNLIPEIQARCAEVPYGHCHCGHAATSGILQFSSHLDERHEYTSCYPEDHGHYCVPLVVNKRTMGVLLLYVPPGFSNDAERESFLYSVADILAGYLSRKAGEEALAEHQAQMETIIRERTANLKTSEARTRAIVTTMLDSVVQIDGQGIIRYVNFAVQEMFGYQGQEMVGHNVSMLMPAPYAAAHDGYISRFMKTRQEHIIGKRVEVLGRRKDGSLFPIEIAINEIVDDSGSSFIGVLRDMTMQKAAEQEVKHALRATQAAAEAKSNFLANMSHEIRTPLNAVLGLAQIGARNNHGRDTVKLFERIRESGSHLLSVVNDILDYSKIEAGRLKIEKRPFALFSVIDNVKSFVSMRAEEKDLDLAISFSQDLSDWVEGDALRLTQILVNLLSNAIKFTAHGEVMLRVARDGDDIVFLVVDSGIGMSEEQQVRLFQSFEQADSSTTRNYGGTGLGLAISRQLARLMGGDISVTSSPGAGSSFYLILPLPAVAPPVHPGLHESAASAGGPRLPGVSILAADDVEINRFILEDLLSLEGARLMFAADGRQALDLLEEKGVNAFDVVLMDVQMPVMDGLEATRRIAEIAPALPVIGLTAHAMAEERDKCLAAGMVDHVAKPVDIDTLVAAIRRQVNVATKFEASAAPPVAVLVDVPASCNDPAVIDLGILAARLGNDPAKIAKYAVRFVETARDTLAEMRAASDAGDEAALRRLGHRLKSAALTVGAMRFGEICNELQSLPEGGDFEAARSRVDQLHALFEQIAQRVGDAS